MVLFNNIKLPYFVLANFIMRMLRNYVTLIMLSSLQTMGILNICMKGKKTTLNAYNANKVRLIIDLAVFVMVKV